MHRAPAAADGVCIAVALEAAGAQLHRDDLFGVDGAVPGVAHRFQRQPVVRRLDALDSHFQ